MKLYLGAGRKRLAGYIHVDVVGGPTINVVHDLNRVPWPWADNSIETIVAEDLVEHLDIDLIRFCNEAWRIIVPGGELYVRTPHYKGESSWIDPTHRWHFNEQAFHYLDPDTYWGSTYPHYTERKWEIVSLGIRGPQNIVVILRARKQKTESDSAVKVNESATQISNNSISNDPLPPASSNNNLDAIANV